MERGHKDQLIPPALLIRVGEDDDAEVVVWRKRDRRGGAGNAPVMLYDLRHSA